ncbi:M28 family peptidase [Pseudoalteromonas pernae]|uniref:M28 family peptidase n=1 Tax=Pseudoalteromonas pernae TaxID=3118054 RepID=UPI003241DB99
MRHQLTFCVFAALCSLVCCKAIARQINAEPAWYVDIATLTSDTMAGRQAGTPSATMATQYIQSRLQELGYSTEQQEFEFKKGFFSKAIGYNVVSTDCQRNCLVISAHYDHLGTKGNKIYAGANDNASGVAAMLYLAQRLEPFKDRITFVAFDAEEPGLYGAYHFVARVPNEQLAMNINLDMLKLPKANSRLFFFTRDNLCTRAIEQLGNSTIKTQIAKSNQAINRRVKDDRVDWLRASDHWAFAKQKIPFVFITGAEDPHYHSPTDTLSNFDTDRYQQTLYLLQGFTEQLLSAHCSDSFVLG